MPTVNHVQRSNIPLAVTISNQAFRAFWELTRAMKKAGWKYKASGDALAKETTGNPALDKWNASLGVTTNAGAAAASIAAPTLGRANVTGLAGIVAADKGRFLLISGGATSANNNQHQIEEVISATEVRIDARQFAVASDANNGALTWSIRDPSQELFSLLPNNPKASTGWWCAQGPSTLKIPITAASVGAFKRGENITQATTGAEGELVGYTYYNGAGWLVVSPRLRGIGSGAFGWDTGNVITGDRSGATVSQNGVAIDYVWEVVFVKPANMTNIMIHIIQADKVGESAELFSVLATSAGATASVAPGGGGTGNAFPVHAWVAYGLGTTAGFELVMSGTTAGGYPASGHVLCTDAIPEENYSADGSWAAVLFFHYSSSAQSTLVAQLYGFQRLNDTEDGEISLYVSVVPPSGSAVLRTASGSTPIAYFPDVWAFTSQDVGLPQQGYSGIYAGWSRRGLSGDTFTSFSAAAQTLFQSAVFVAEGKGTERWVLAQRMQASAHPFVKPREKLWLTTTANRGYKGSFRWLYWVSAGRLGDVYGDSPGWVQISYGLGANSSYGTQGQMPGGGALIVGPHNGVPISMQSLGG